jgi:purine-binding chemotaxis protein CheW
MKPVGPSAADLPGELRRAFDSSFAEAPSAEGEPDETLLNIRLGNTGYALRTRDISGLFVDMPITPIPSPVPELVGICALRGSILAAYDLAALLGYPPEAAPRWFAIAGTVSLGLVFAGFEGQVRVARAAIVPNGPDRAMRHVREILAAGGVVRPILSIASILESITSRVRSGGSQKE